MKNIFDLRKWEQELETREVNLRLLEKTYVAKIQLEAFEKKNEIAEMEAKHKKEIKFEEVTHSTEISDLKIKHREELSALREEMKTELGAKAIDLEKENAVLEKELSLKNTHIFELINDKRNLEKELQLMTNVALEASAKSAEVKVIDTKVVSPQVVEGKINVISTCGK